MKYAFILIALLAVFAACEAEQTTDAPQTPEEPVQPPTAPPEDREATSAPQNTVPTDERTIAQRVFGSDEVPTQPVPAEVEAMIARAEERTASGYRFIYSSRIDGQPGRGVYEGAEMLVREDSIVATLSRIQQLPQTTLRVDRLSIRNGQEVAWCTTCREPTYNADHGLSSVPPATVWLYYIEDIELQGQRSIDGRNAMRITATMQDSPIELFIDEFSGLPLRVNWQGTEHRYERVAFGVSAEQVAIP